MENEEEIEVGAMHKRKVVMEDGKRYIVYYTFGESVSAAQNEQKKEENV